MRIEEVLCPVCNKFYIPAPLHQYKVRDKRVCSWHCQLRGEKQIESKRLDKKKKKCYN